MGNIPSEWIWMGLFIVFIAIEASSSSLITIWFAGGSLVSALLAFAGAGIPAQMISFFAVSIGLLCFTRPLVRKYFKKNAERARTNVETMCGKIGIVTKEISEHEYGLVKVDGQIWTATPEDGKGKIIVGEEVLVLGVSGVKLIVKPN